MHGCLQTVAGSPRCPVNPPSGRLKNSALCWFDSPSASRALRATSAGRVRAHQSTAGGACQMARPSSPISCGSSLKKTSLSSSRCSFTRASGCLLAMIPLLITALSCSRTFSELPATFSWLWSLSALATTWAKASCLATPLASLASTSLGAASLSQGRHRSASDLKRRCNILV